MMSPRLALFLAFNAAEAPPTNAQVIEDAAREDSVSLILAAEDLAAEWGLSPNVARDKVERVAAIVTNNEVPTVGRRGGLGRSTRNTGRWVQVHTHRSRAETRARKRAGSRANNAQGTRGPSLTDIPARPGRPFHTE